MLIFADIQEYCDGDTFEAKCKQDEVIVMKSALYGRVRIGKCVSADSGLIGCKENVTDLVNKHCSGRNECSLDVTPSQFEGLKPCPGDSKSYLQIEYACMKSKFWFNLILRNIWKVSEIKVLAFPIYCLCVLCLVVESLSQIRRNRDKEYCFLIHIPEFLNNCPVKVD